MLTVGAARKAVRLTSDQFDEELDGLIYAAILDLARVGIAQLEDDELYDQALRMYVKGHFEPGAPDAEACRKIYNALKEDMKLSDGYREGSKNE